MKLYALMNWKEKEPKITAVNGMAMVMVDKKKLMEVWKMFSDQFPTDVRVELVEFESVEKK